MTSLFAPSGLDRTAVRRQFDRRTDPAADFLAPEVATRMTDRLSLIKLEPGRMLDVGCGLGHARSALQTRWPHAHYVGMDLAPRRVARAAQGGAAWPQRCLDWLKHPRRPPPPASHLAADAHALPYPDQTFDLLWSNLVLHWLDQPAQALAQWQRVLRPHGVLLFSAWGVDTLVELRRAGVPLPAWPDMHDLGDALVKAGFADPVMETERLTITWTDAARMVADVRAWGGDVRVGRRPGCATPRQARQAQSALWQTLRAAQNTAEVGLTIEVIYGHAWRLDRRPAAEAYAPIKWLPRRG